jgi:hypothetical protein
MCGVGRPAHNKFTPHLHGPNGLVLTAHASTRIIRGPPALPTPRQGCPAMLPAKHWLPIALTAALVAVPIAPAAAQQTAPGTRQASFDRSAQAVRFARQLPEIGDQVEQTISVDLRMTTTERNDTQVTGETHSVMRSAQRRVITTSHVADGLAIGVKLRYVTATRQVSQSQDASEPTADPTNPERQPVDGKVYNCRRTGESLVVTDARGDIPPMDEYEIVAQQMEILGRASPLADFLVGRTVHVGQQLSLPGDVAERLLGLDQRLGKTTRFDLTLTGTSSDGGAACAVFQADIEAASNDSSQMRMQMSGPMVVQVDSCRVVRVELAGPIGMSETRGSYSTKYYLTSTGNMAANLRSAYHDVRR